MEKTYGVDVKIKYVSDKAVLVITDKDEEIWLPKSQIICEEDFEADKDVKITLPEWLAIEKDLV
jgi:hypothetical protein